MTTPVSGWRIGQQLVRFAFFEIAFLIAYRFGMSFSQQFAAPFWFPDSVLLTALLLSERRSWWLYVLGALPIRLFLLVDPTLPFWFLLAGFANDSLKALLSAWLLSHLSRPPVWFENLRNFIRYFLIAVLLSPGLSALAGAATRLYLGDPFWVAWRNWFLGNALASVILTPLLVVALTAQHKAGIDIVHRLPEGILVGAGLVVAGYVAFYGGISGFPPGLLYLPVPFLLWAAVRFEPAGAPLSLPVISVSAILGTIEGRGPFHLESAAQNLLSIQLFLFFVSVPFMFLSVLITQQHRTDVALRESEERFRSLVDAGPVMVWMSGLDGLCRFFNKPWLDFTDRSMASELGNGWAEGVHPDDRESCVNQYLAAFEARRKFTLEYRLRRQDGIYRWILDQGIPRYGSDGSFLGYVGSCIDISDRKDAEDKLRLLHVQIVQVQEAERSRIAQELHDDLAQRTAMISMRLDQISRQHKDNARLQNEVYELQQSAQDLGAEITRIARQLHPRTVERLGLFYSLRILCQQFSNDQRTVSFLCDRELPLIGIESSVSLYRIAQESLRNALTHGGATEVVIEASTTTTVFQLSIKDNGCGFVVGSIDASGLGLSGMAERMRNVGGTLTIHSAPGRGTTVTATVPIAEAMKATN